MSDISNLRDNLERFVASRTASATEELYEKIKERTPVRGGTAQRGWERNRPSDTKLEDGIIGNNVDYVKFLEYGTSDQAPYGMIRVSISELLTARRR